MEKCSDPIDELQEISDLFINDEINKSRKKLIDYSKITKCVNPECDLSPIKNTRFCSRDCRDEYEILLKTKRIHE